MPDISWTNEQTEAIETHGKNILVAAAAGSGKTAVLVERVIRMICDEENPISVDSLLILTFTTAAADEMKRKISAAINKKLAENPDNAYLKEQSIKVGSAAISTIHSFCSRIISNNAHLTKLPADYTLIASTAENDLLISRALDIVLEAYYSRIDKKEAFRQLVLSSGTKDDKELREIIIKIYKFSQSLPYPKKWLRTVRRDMYARSRAETAAAEEAVTVLGNPQGISDEDGDAEAFYNSPWYLPIKQRICRYARTMYDGIIKLTEIIVAEEVPADSPHYQYYFGLKHDFCIMYDSLDLEKPADFDRFCDYLNGFALPAVSRSQKYISDIKPTLNFYRKDVVGAALEKAKELTYAFETECICNYTKSAASIRTLCNIVQLLEYNHTKLKREHCAIDFSDLEHQLLNLICDSDGNETPLCEKLRDRYAEIMLDEFQDTNSLQFEIFSHLSKKDGNLFMVGDVKQSIYKFRNADPSIFLGLYNDYAKEDGGHLIRLFKNFRSRREVVDSVNHVFHTVMTCETGGIDYSEEEYLVKGADYPEGDGTQSCDYTTEIMITHLPEGAEDSETKQKIDSSVIEAEEVAKRIIGLVRDQKLKVTDKETRQLRPARYGDIAVLAPGWSGCLCVEEALNKEGIACFCEKSSHYLDSVEVATVLAFLQIIDNPLQDIPLIAVLRSPIFAFTANQLAEIRSCGDGRFYNALKKAAEIFDNLSDTEKAKAAAEEAEHNLTDNAEGNYATYKKAYDFTEVLKELRASSKYMGVDELVRKICFELDYLPMVSAMKDGELRSANLKLLIKRCSDFEDGVLHGLFNFMQYIEKLRSGAEDLRPASEGGDFADTVTVMTIHKSKGLEFPVVILFGMDKTVNISDATKRFVWNAELGIAADYVDTNLRICYDMPQKTLISSEIRKELYAERLRLLYVAMTRAKEKLIISAKQQKMYSAWKSAVYTEDGRLHPNSVLKMSSMRDWIWASVLKAPDGRLLREFGERTDIVSDLGISAEYKVYMTQKDRDTEADEADISAELPAAEAETESDELTAEIKDRISYMYPHTEITRLPIKLSVSELKRRRMPEEEHSVNLINPQSGLIHGTEELSAAEKGTVTHFVMQHINIKDTDSRESIEKQINNMAETGMISQEQRNAVNYDAVAGFFETPLGSRLKSAEGFEREYDFYMVVPATEAYPDAPKDAEIMVQGIADCFFYDKEADGIVLIDYKTDRVGVQSAAAKAATYQTQIDYYAKGLEAIFEKPVTEKYIYFLECGTAVNMK